MISTAGQGDLMAWLHEAAVSETDDCVLWPFDSLNKGYGQVYVDGKNTAAHLVILDLTGRPRPVAGEETRHLCGIRACNNPRHLLVGTARENSLDKRDHGTMLRGEMHSQAKLDEASVLAIRNAWESGASQASLARQYGVSSSTVWRVVHSYGWSHL